jgi:phospholipid/cholesterol/gamma-HCH transport system substrate-binding protein
MANNVIETVMGAVVLTVAGGFLYFAYNNSNVKAVDGYEVKADFSSVSGVGLGSDVRIGGIKVGVIESLDLDPKTYEAVLTLRIKEEIKLPKDSSAAIQSASLLGEKFVTIDPGGDEEMLKDGDTITYTQASVNLEEMIGKFVFSGGGVEGGEKTDDANSLSTGIE